MMTTIYIMFMAGQETSGFRDEKMVRCFIAMQYLKLAPEYVRRPAEALRRNHFQSHPRMARSDCYACQELTFSRKHSTNRANSPVVVRAVPSAALPTQQRGRGRQRLSLFLRIGYKHWCKRPKAAAQVIDRPADRWGRFQYHTHEVEGSIPSAPIRRTR
jgi:hypothetical protein